MKLFKYLFAGLLILNFSACDDKDDKEIENEADNDSTPSETTIEANRFVYEIMNTYYYWVSELPNLDYRKQPDTKDYFYALKYSGDRFSFIYDDAQAYLNEESGISTSMGWDPTYMLYQTGESRVVAMINYVYHDTPAEAAGAKRGDIVLYVDGQEMNATNYNTLFNSSSAEYTVARYNAEKGDYEQVSYKISARELTISPVAEHEIFETENGKVGYLLYLDYYSEFNGELDKVFSEFKAAGVKELILDLRYNPGGQMLAMCHLCSLIAPTANVAAGDLLIWYEYNDLLKNEDGFDKKSNATYFESEYAANSLNLNRVVVITGSSTYSASESTIIGLKPYMDVVTVGDVTGGKNTAMFVLTPEDIYQTDKKGNKKPYYDSSINNWLIAPIVAVYKNSKDYTFDTSNNKGMTPDYVVDEYSFSDMGTLGDANEHLTAAALEYIATGNVADANKALKVSREKLANRNKVGRAVIPTLEFVK